MRLSHERQRQWNTQGKGSALAGEAVAAHGRGSALAGKAVIAQGKGSALAGKAVAAQGKGSVVPFSSDPMFASVLRHPELKLNNHPSCFV